MNLTIPPYGLQLLNNLGSEDRLGSIDLYHWPHSQRPIEFGQQLGTQLLQGMGRMPLALFLMEPAADGLPLLPATAVRSTRQTIPKPPIGPRPGRRPLLIFGGVATGALKFRPATRD
jgi:hypothetical protein